MTDDVKTDRENAGGRRCADSVAMLAAIAAVLVALGRRTGR